MDSIHKFFAVISFLIQIPNKLLYHIKENYKTSLSLDVDKIQVHDNGLVITRLYQKLKPLHYLNKLCKELLNEMITNIFLTTLLKSKKTKNSLLKINTCKHHKYYFLNYPCKK